MNVTFQAHVQNKCKRVSYARGGYGYPPSKAAGYGYPARAITSSEHEPMCLYCGGRAWGVAQCLAEKKALFLRHQTKHLDAGVLETAGDDLGRLL